SGMCLAGNWLWPIGPPAWRFVRSSSLGHRGPMKHCRGSSESCRRTRSASWWRRLRSFRPGFPEAWERLRMADLFLTLSKDDRSEALAVAADRTGRPIHLLEKDAWVVCTLQTL